MLSNKDNAGQCPALSLFDGDVKIASAFPYI